MEILVNCLWLSSLLFNCINWRWFYRHGIIINLYPLSFLSPVLLPFFLPFFLSTILYLFIFHLSLLLLHLPFFIHSFIPFYPPYLVLLFSYSLLFYFYLFLQFFLFLQICVDEKKTVKQKAQILSYDLIKKSFVKVFHGIWTILLEIVTILNDSAYQIMHFSSTVYFTFLRKEFLPKLVFWSHFFLFRNRFRNWLCSANSDTNDWPTCRSDFTYFYFQLWRLNNYRSIIQYLKKKERVSD